MNENEPESTKLPNLYSVELPEWVENFIYDYGGVRPEKVSFTDIESVCNADDTSKIFVYEKSFLEHSDYFFNLLKDNVIKQLIVFNHHPFNFTNELLERINTLTTDDNIVLLVNGYYSRKYANIKSYHFDLFENTIAHHFNLLLSTILHSKRNIEKDFLVQVVPRDEFRKTVVGFMENTDLFDNSITSFAKTSKSLHHDADTFLEHVKKKYGDGQHIPALTSFIGGVPNFESYEKILCEIVLETRNSGSWHFTEKLFRPIALGIPIVFLGDVQMFNQITQNGYRFYDHGFYSHWHSESSLEKKLSHLQDFLQHIKQESTVKQSMTEIAQHNYKWFWDHRKNYYHKGLYDCFANISNTNNVIHNIYKELNF